MNHMLSILHYYRYAREHKKSIIHIHESICNAIITINHPIQTNPVLPWSLLLTISPSLTYLSSEVLNKKGDKQASTPGQLLLEGIKVKYTKITSPRFLYSLATLCFRHSHHPTPPLPVRAIPLTSRTSHPRPNPHTPHHLLILNNHPPTSKHVPQRFHHPLKTTLRAPFLRKACNSDVGSAAAVEQSVELGGEGEGGNVEGYLLIVSIMGMGDGGGGRSRGWGVTYNS